MHAFFSIHLRADQIVGGTAINFLALGVTGYLFIDIYGAEGTPDRHPAIPNVHPRFARGHPAVGFLGDVFGELNLMIWLAFALVLVTWVVVFKTPIGLRIRAVGEHPRAADTVGINVYAVRYGGVVLSGMLAARGRRVPLDRLRPLVHREHDRGPRLHRAGGADLRELAPVRRRGRVPALRLLERARAAPAGVLGIRRPCSSRRSRTCSR